MGLFAWGSHIEGAVEIVKARSLEQRKSRSGLSLFIAVRTQMVSGCSHVPLREYAHMFPFKTGLTIALTTFRSFTVLPPARHLIWTLTGG